MRHINLKKSRMSSWRKIAVGTWSSPGDPSIYGILEIDARPMLNAIEKWKSEKGKKVTITHVVGSAAGRLLGDYPQLNSMIRFGQIYQRKNVDIFFQVAVDESGDELSGVVIREMDRKNPFQLADEIREEAGKVRSGDLKYKKGKNIFKWLPPFLARPFLTAIGFILYALNIYSRVFGVPKDPFGGMMITSVGMLGLGTGFAPLVPYSRVPSVLVVGEIKEKPFVEDGQVIAAPVLTLCATIDHRIIDGVHASKMIKALKHYLLHPELLC